MYTYKYICIYIYMYRCIYIYIYISVAPLVRAREVNPWVLGSVLLPRTQIPMDLNYTDPQSGVRNYC